MALAKMSELKKHI